MSQFLDIGAGLPAPGNTHEVAQEIRPDSRVVYVDFDPVVLAHARAFMVGREPGSTAYIDADLRNPGNILEQARQTFDFSRPVGLLLIAILHAIPDEDDPHRIVAELMDALPGGSCLAVTHWAGNQEGPKQPETFVDLSKEMSRQQYIPRGNERIADFFTGLDLVEPGLVPIQDWRPGPHDEPEEDTSWIMTGGVARKA